MKLLIISLAYTLLNKINLFFFQSLFLLSTNYQHPRNERLRTIADRAFRESKKNMIL